MRRRPAIALGFVALILVGAILLSSPWARAAGSWGDAGKALFMATSAVCVTGLTVVDVATEYALPGQIVLLALVEIGCLGLIACGTFLLVAIGRRLSLSREFALMNAYGVAAIQGLRGLVCWVVGSMLVIEGAAAVLLTWRFGDAYRGIFYAVMGFCNAGFSLCPGSLARFADDPWVILTLAVETVLGGIGFLVLYNLCTFKFRRARGGVRGRLSLHTRVVLQMTLVLVAVAFALFLASEWTGALAGFPPVKKLVVGFLQAVTPRTCGFSAVATESLRPFTRLVYEALMFIGGAPGSSAAGIKVTTLAVLVATLRAMCRGEEETVLGARVVPNEIVRESIVIVMAMLTFCCLVVGALFLTEDVAARGADALVFEAVSAVTTTGLSIGDTTARLSPVGRFIVMSAMFFGRLGALSVVLMIGDRESKRHVRFPTEELVVG